MAATFTRLFENLESRVLFSMGNGSYAPLVINGTNLADTILVSQSGEIITVNVNGVVTTHDTYRPIYGSAQYVHTGAHVITKVIVNGLGGSDTI